MLGLGAEHGSVRQNTVSNNQSVTAKRHRVRSSRTGRRSVVIVAFSCLCVAIVALAANFASPWFGRIFTDVNSANSGESRTGTVMVETNEGQCEILKFDNDTGRTTEGSRLCQSSVTLDAHGVPIPMATARRLDEISKSFGGGGH
jgi:hypothetical protein